MVYSGDRGLIEKLATELKTACDREDDIRRIIETADDEALE
jgi:hypothetical protein